MAGQAAETQGEDGNGNFLRIGAAGGPDTIETGQTNYYGPAGTKFAQADLPPLRTRPAYPNRVPALNRSVPCYTQPVPNVNGAASTGPADGARPDAPPPPLPERPDGEDPVSRTIRDIRRQARALVLLAAGDRLRSGRRRVSRRPPADRVADLGSVCRKAGVRAQGSGQRGGGRASGPGPGGDDRRRGCRRDRRRDAHQRGAGRQHGNQPAVRQPHLLERDRPAAAEDGPQRHGRRARSRERRRRNPATQWRDAGRVPDTADGQPRRSPLAARRRYAGRADDARLECGSGARQGRRHESRQRVPPVRPALARRPRRQATSSRCAASSSSG